MRQFSDAARRLARSATDTLQARQAGARVLAGLRPGATGVRQHRATVASGGVAALALGVLLLPGHHAAAQTTVHPTLPGSSVFTATAAPHQDGHLVQVGEPTSYKQPRSVSAQDRVAVAHNLTPAEQPQPAAPAQPQQQAQPQPQQQPQQPAAPAQPQQQASPDWSSPAPGAPTSNPYHKTNRSYAAGFHTGVDFAVRTGTPLVSVGNATVVSAGWAGAYGNQVVLKLSDGHFAQYAHMSKLAVHAGQHVKAGDRVGLSGSTGNSTGPHLHFEIRTANRYGAVIDPIAYLSAHGATNF
ncbi:M23 family metallopeptidase [Kitasatospora sp. NPDC059571]|uniref:M23 family metallopeptidase n=1 Tax=Kitasatospora sp. NPDC059571 TaxID=3346871 RepID=UPI0036CAA337